MTIITARTKSPAPETQVVREVADVLARRAALDRPPTSIAVSDAVALGIAELFRSPTISGQVMDAFVRTGRVDRDELVKAARFEQGYASPEGHAALHCLIGWARARQVRETARATR